MHRLLDALDVYNACTQDERGACEAAIWERLGEEGTALVLDMSGFSRTVRSRGIVFYLAMVRRMQRATQPLVTRHGGRVVKYEADNLFALFKEPDAALGCALAINAAFNAEEFPSADSERKIHVCIGIEFGRLLHIPDHDYFGESVNTASLLGEDIAEPGHVLVGPAASARLSAALRGHGKAVTIDAKGGPIAVLRFIGETVLEGEEVHAGTPLD